MAEGRVSAGVELLCVGTELLLGNILNGNARWLGEQLASLGLPHYRQSVLGDNRERMIGFVREASERSRVLITTGGLGPTPDDLTTEAIAAAFETPLEERPEVWSDIKAKARSRGRDPSPSTRRQALLPRGAEVLPNPTGTAPGLIWSPRPGFTVLTFPGVPSEMRAMWTATAAPWFRSQNLAAGTFTSRKLHFWGIGESTLAEQIPDLLAGSNPTVAPYAGGGEVMLRLTACAPTTREGQQMLVPLEAELRRRTGPCCFGADGDTLASVVLDQLRSVGQTVAVAESCTGGGLGAALTASPGASAVMLGGVIAYADAVKQALLGVSADQLTAHGAVSEVVAKAMAEGVRRALQSDWGLAVTGIAGPGGGSEEKPVGMVCFAIAGPRGTTGFSRHYGHTRGRDWVRRLSVGDALDELRRHWLAWQESC